ncbi:MAG TPA: glycosyltransferase, partial [Anaerolineales bacterium]|nr:glycosyltransferase [Anaerolineales bacterium]
ESAAMQETNFEYEILISEDCSTDRTRQIVKEFQQEHPDKVRLLLSEQNIRSNEIVVRGIRAARGEYIALLDGDDYWTSPYKLQKQADFLDRHPECTLCFHNARIFHEADSREGRNWTPLDQKEISTLEDLWMGNFIATCSAMFRGGVIGEIPAWYNDFFPITDWPLHILHAERGKIGYINEVMGVYRYHPGGLYSPFSETKKQQETLKFYRTMNRNLNYRYNRIVNIAISRYFFEWAEEYRNRGDLEKMRVCLKSCLSARPFNSYIPKKKLLKMWLARS